MTTATDTIRRIVAEHYSTAIETIADESRFDELGSRDWLDPASITVEVNRELAIEISLAEMDAVKTVADLSALVEQKLKINAGHA